MFVHTVNVKRKKKKPLKLILWLCEVKYFKFSAEVRGEVLLKQRTSCSFLPFVISQLAGAETFLKMYIYFEADTQLGFLFCRIVK